MVVAATIFGNSCNIINGPHGKDKLLLEDDVETELEAWENHEDKGEQYEVAAKADIGCEDDANDSKVRGDLDNVQH